MGIQLTKEDFLVSVIGHLREEKDPFCVVRSLALLPTDSKITVTHLGQAMSPQMKDQATNFNATSIATNGLVR